MIPGGFLEASLLWAMGLMTAGGLLAFARLLRGPSLCDRVVALDLMMILSVGIVALRSIRSGETVFLSAIAVTALIAFLGTIGFVYYIEKKRPS